MQTKSEIKKKKEKIVNKEKDKIFILNIKSNKYFAGLLTLQCVCVIIKTS